MFVKMENVYASITVGHLVIDIQDVHNLLIYLFIELSCDPEKPDNLD